MKQPIAPDHLQPAEFHFADLKQVSEIIARYPEGCQQSAIMPLLYLAQSQSEQQWIPRAAMDKIADIVGVPPIRVYEVATFYSMYNLAPIGKHHVQVCTTTPCWLRGSADIMKACERFTGCHHGQTSADGQFTVSEVECLGACVNAPMVQINDDFYEDLTPERIQEILQMLKDGKDVSIGSQTGRQTSKAAAI